ncbi:hypothetical protein ACG9HX_02985 [Acinetobacter ursingii]|uniref:Uncharacterized protein n=1 Tax=Acinetobacter ursingii TaxID=108980 RepID=A0AA46S385_9GAMM|nr:hypothetical protein [Acinetobacter ursingii]UYF71352.1 hypothetical protein LSO60_14080 [Acinetobacter ursingii]
MLDFWYSERCTRGIKLGICIATCVIIYLSSTTEKLPALFVVMSLLLGMIHHFLQQKISRIQADNPYAEGFSIIGFVLPIIALITLIAFLPQPHQWILAIQVIGFSALGLFMVSIYQNRAPR